MIQRQPYENEVGQLTSTDGKTVFSIRLRDDKNYEFYVKELRFDDEEEIHYWSQEMLPRPSIFGSIVDAKAEIFAQFGQYFSSS